MPAFALNSSVFVIIDACTGSLLSDETGLAVQARKDSTVTFRQSGFTLCHIFAKCTRGSWSFAIQDAAVEGKYLGIFEAEDARSARQYQWSIEHIEPGRKLQFSMDSTRKVHQLN